LAHFVFNRDALWFVFVELFKADSWQPIAKQEDTLKLRWEIQIHNSKIYLNKYFF
jgi:hypothetical protein